MVGQGLGGQSGTWMGELECTPDGEGHSRGESAEKDDIQVAIHTLPE